MGTRLYIGNLPYRTNEDELRGLFGQAGEVVDVAIPIERDSGRPRGFAFVEMADEAAAAQAIQQFNGYVLLGRELRVNESQPRPSMGGGRDNRREDRGGRGGWGRDEG